YHSTPLALTVALPLVAANTAVRGPAAATLSTVEPGARQATRIVEPPHAAWMVASELPVVEYASLPKHWVNPFAVTAAMGKFCCTPTGVPAVPPLQAPPTQYGAAAPVQVRPQPPQFDASPPPVLASQPLPGFRS